MVDGSRLKPQLDELRARYDPVLAAGQRGDRPLTGSIARDNVARTTARIARLTLTTHIVVNSTRERCAPTRMTLFRVAQLGRAAIGPAA
jgi:hypothetical protein